MSRYYSYSLDFHEKDRVPYHYYVNKISPEAKILNKEINVFRAPSYINNLLNKLENKTNGGKNEQDVKLSINGVLSNFLFGIKYVSEEEFAKEGYLKYIERLYKVLLKLDDYPMFQKQKMKDLQQIVNMTILKFGYSYDTNTAFSILKSAFDTYESFKVLPFIETYCTKCSIRKADANQIIFSNKLVDMRNKYAKRFLE